MAKPDKYILRRLCAVVCVALVAGCAGGPPATEGPPISPEAARATIEHSLPGGVQDRAGWVEDIYSGFSVQDLEPSPKNICAVVAVIGQESSFHVDPVVPGLGAIARKEIDSRAQRVGVPTLLVHDALELRSSNGRTYNQRIDAARTEKDLSDIYEDFIAAIPLGRTLFADLNPIRTRGPMQVNVAFANQYAALRPYPYHVAGSIADEVFTRRGSLYFGIGHLLAYAAPYDAYLYRFLDYNAGQYASRNAAFQSAVSVLAGMPLLADGALLSDKGGSNRAGDTELAVRTVAARLKIDDTEIHAALEQGKSAQFEQTELYKRVFSLAERAAGTHCRAPYCQPLTCTDRSSAEL